MFPAHFAWGAGTSSYQIEGAAAEDGKGPSVWDLFTHTEGRIWQNQTGDTASDHYHRYQEDVALMQEIGLTAYRFSISWPRVLPDGVKMVNAKGLDFYSRLVDALLAANITPYATLFHWDFPLALYYKGGWLNRDVADWFGDYTETVVKHLGDRVRHWITLNEPAAVTGAGHYWGVHAPGLRMGPRETLRVGYHTLLAHGSAVQAIRAVSPQPAQVGTAFDTFLYLPLTDQPEDIEAARRLTFGISNKNLQSNVLWLDPALGGGYPAEAEAVFGADLPSVTPDDLRHIHQPIDFLGINIYHGEYAHMDQHGLPEPCWPPLGHPRTHTGPMTPEALYWGPRFLWERYQRPLIITENGLPLPDWIASDGQVHDPQRIDFIQQYLAQLARAVSEGVDVRGYFHWSLMDNFEWQGGFQYRFGLIHIDYPTQRRTLKQSAHWYRALIETNSR